MKLTFCLLLTAALGNAQSAGDQFRPVWGQSGNLADITAQLIKYHDLGQYDYEIRQVTEAARSYAEERTKRVGKTEKLAAVFDIDETSLSNWDAMADCGFCSYKIQSKYYSIEHDPAILPVLDLFNYLKARGVKPFFLTGRPESQRGLTIANLKDAGYEGWEDLIMRPPGNTDPARVYKSAHRKEIESKGYLIVLNIGDQASDLAGCCAERSFKVPNPFYLLP
jgi:acid phosphatase